MAGIDGKMYGEMVISAANALENQKEDINSLNVFPVPDGPKKMAESKVLFFMEL